MVGNYKSRRSSNNFTMWQLNWNGELYSVFIHNNENEIVIIYNSSANKMVYMCTVSQLELNDLYVI